jgi:hypothetical protein
MIYFEIQINLMANIFLLHIRNGSLYEIFHVLPEVIRRRNKTSPIA